MTQIKNGRMKEIGMDAQREAEENSERVHGGVWHGRIKRIDMARDVLHDMHDALKRDQCGQSTLYVSREEAEAAYWYSNSPWMSWSDSDECKYARKHFANPSERNAVVNCE